MDQEYNKLPEDLTGQRGSSLNRPRQPLPENQTFTQNSSAESKWDNLTAFEEILNQDGTS